MVEIIPELIPTDLPDPSLYPFDYYEYIQAEAAEAIIKESPPGVISPTGGFYQRVILKKKRIYYANVSWRFAYMKVRSSTDTTKRRFYAGMIEDPNLLALIEDARRSLREPNYAGECRLYTTEQDDLIVDLKYAAIRHEHMIVGWTEYRPRGR